jgi:ubiquinone biosynthesis monooxygenase Coq7
MTNSSKQKHLSRQITGLSSNQEIARMIRVDHAGELGARFIYQGQLAALKGQSCYQEIKHMQEQELKHLSYFEEEIRKRGVRPTFLSPVWSLLGFGLGYVTGKMGEKAAMACTEAVEEVIGEHYQSQVDTLENYPEEKALKEMIIKFRDEEMEHLNTAVEHDAGGAPGYGVLSGAIKLATKAAIQIAKRV